jgi:hypothetical protein
MSGAIPLLPQYAFMVLCSVKKAQGKLHLYLYLYIFVYYVYNAFILYIYILLFALLGRRREVKIISTER